MNGSDDLRGTTALVTGGSSGLGRATALALAAAGADIAVLARGSAELAQTAERAGASGARLRPASPGLQAPWRVSAPAFPVSGVPSGGAWARL